MATKNKEMMNERVIAGILSDYGDDERVLQLVEAYRRLNEMQTTVTRAAVIYATWANKDGDKPRKR